MARRKSERRESCALENVRHQHVSATIVGKVRSEARNKLTSRSKVRVEERASKLILWLPGKQRWVRDHQVKEFAFADSRPEGAFAHIYSARDVVEGGVQSRACDGSWRNIDGHSATAL